MHYVLIMRALCILGKIALSTYKKLEKKIVKIMTLD